MSTLYRVVVAALFGLFSLSSNGVSATDAQLNARETNQPSGRLNDPEGQPLLSDMPLVSGDTFPMGRHGESFDEIHVLEVTVAAIYLRSTLETGGDAVSTRLISDQPTRLKTPVQQLTHLSR